MRIATRRLPLVKRNPLTISRGTSAATENLVVEIEHDGLVGRGEMAPNTVTADTADDAEAALARWAEPLLACAPWERQRVAAICDADPAAGPGIGGPGGTATRSALETACWDWLGKRAGMPVGRLLGLDPARIVATSVTVGINPPDVAAAQARDWRERTGARCLKIKLGSPAGIDADQAMYEAVRAAAGPDARLRVDANGGWSVDDARTMMAWLAARGAEYVEQPLPAGAEDDLPALRPSPLPLFVDESVHLARHVPKIADRVDGVNVKLMKTGGIDEALRVVHAARAHGLLTMLGCMGESSLAIAAGVQIAPLFDHLDLDSHLNLRVDPFEGLGWSDGRVTASDAPGLGVRPC